jgi:uncharacterized LabA/DUF88 family protein
MPDRAIVFIDGSNWYHSLKEAGISRPLGDIDIGKVSKKLVGPAREWLGTRYYTGRVNQQEAPEVYAKQRRFMSRLIQNPKVTAHYGRLESRPAMNKLAEELAQYMASLRMRIEITIYQNLVSMAHRHRKVMITQEKAVDVMLSVDLVLMGHRNEYDAAYLLTADGDYTPAVKAVREIGKRVYCASPATGAQLAAAANTFIPLKAAFFDDCMY